MSSCSQIAKYEKGISLLISSSEKRKKEGKAEIFKDREIVSIYDFCECIPFWKEQGKEMVSDFLKKRSEVLIEQLQSKEKKRPKSSALVRSKTTTQFHPY